MPRSVASAADAALIPNDDSDALSRKTGCAPSARMACPDMTGPRAETPTRSPDRTPTARQAAIRADVPLETQRANCASVNAAKAFSRSTTTEEFPDPPSATARSRWSMRSPLSGHPLQAACPEQRVEGVIHRYELVKLSDTVRATRLPAGDPLAKRRQLRRVASGGVADAGR